MQEPGPPPGRRYWSTLGLHMPAWILIDLYRYMHIYISEVCMRLSRDRCRDHYKCTHMCFRPRMRPGQTTWRLQKIGWLKICMHAGATLQECHPYHIPANPSAKQAIAPRLRNVSLQVAAATSEKEALLPSANFPCRRACGYRGGQKWRRNIRTLPRWNGRASSAGWPTAMT